MPFSLDVLRDLIGHMQWADATVWRAVLAHPAAARDERLRNLLLHLHAVQRAFLHVWTSRPVSLPTPDTFADIASVQAWSHPYYAELANFLAGLDQASLTRPVEMPWLAEFEQRVGRRFDKPTLAETMFQVTSHSTYHRGQVNMRLREIGGEPPLVDFIAWVWFGKPAPEWVATT
jgi:uncharacterized damage-inducible protein DinB